MLERSQVNVCVSFPPPHFAGVSEHSKSDAEFQWRQKNLVPHRLRNFAFGPRFLFPWLMSYYGHETFCRPNLICAALFDFVAHFPIRATKNVIAHVQF